MKFSLLLMLVSLSTIGCSNKDVYQYLQQEKKRYCAEQPESQYAECIEEANRTFQEYEKEREQLPESK